MNKREHVSGFIESCAETSPAQLATALINWIGDTNDLIRCADNYLGYGDAPCPGGCPETRDECTCEDEDEDPDTCGMCGDALGDGQRIAWIDGDGDEWAVHEDCYRGGRYLSLEAYCASEARKVTVNDAVDLLRKQAPYPETDATGVLYRG